MNDLSSEWQQKGATLSDSASKSRVPEEVLALTNYDLFSSS
jgi:hypothetical protein